jgi:hypothetical protein
MNKKEVEAMKKHWADKFILRHLFWFLVLPHQFEQWLKEVEATHE